jgi:curved DNA-binding protein CbpA
MPYFYDCTNKEEARKRYLELAKKLHPDKGGSDKEFKDMQAEYDRFDEPQFRFNTINEGFGARYNQNMNQGFNPFRQYNTSKDDQINSLNDQIVSLNQRFMRLYDECINLQNHNSELNKANAMQANYITELKEHWLIGRLIKWFKMNVEFGP